ncbi:MAG TPA: alkaline phosphatase family protein, partial [Patescibacteria group bacterium]|nr:alkaline phosphatase family protein [Patescibacteria group bacterium]
MLSRLLRAAALAVLLAACAGVGGDPRVGRAPIDHVVVLFLENRSFDHLFGTYPGADGLANYRGRQADKSGATYATLPPPLGRDGKADLRFPGALPNAPFPLLRFVQPFDLTNNPVHRFYHMQRQYAAGADGVPMGKWVAEGTSGGITMGFYDRAASPVQWRLADEFVLLDRYFQSIHGGSFANHYFLITAAVAHVGDDPEYRAV